MKADPVLRRLEKLELAALNAWQAIKVLRFDYMACQAAKAEQAKPSRRAA